MSCVSNWMREPDNQRDNKIRHWLRHSITFHQVLSYCPLVVWILKVYPPNKETLLGG